MACKHQRDRDPVGHDDRRVSSGRTRGAAFFAAACMATLARALAAQASATVDLGVAHVRYAGFLSSAAISLTPALLVERRSAALSLRGTCLVFQSGNRSLQGALAASAVRRITGGWRAEVWGAGGASSYADVASFWHAFGGARALHTAGRATVWADVSGGASSHGGKPRPLAGVGAGVWTRRAGVTLGLSGSHTRVGDTVYTDFLAEGRQSVAGVLLRAEIGARVWSRGGGSGVYGEGSAAKRLSQRFALVVAGGSYPNDPARGSISGRYVSAALRLGVWSPRPNAPRWPASLPSSMGPTRDRGSSSSSEPWLEVRPETKGVRLVVHAPDASSVEVAGDFTDWRPVPLVAVGSGVWEALMAIPPGLHRANVRLSGGPWLVPHGMRRAADDYGAEIGVFVVP